MGEIGVGGVGFGVVGGRRSNFRRVEGSVCGGIKGRDEVGDGGVDRTLVQRSP